MKSQVLACLLLVAGLCGAARADSWMPATTEVVPSPNGKARATIVPRGLANNLAYFTDAVKDKAKPGQAEGGNPQPYAKVEVKDAGGTWRVLWEGPLVNDVAPVDVLLTDDGRHLVTFDNWHSVGYGDDAVVLYDASGKVVRQWAVADFLGAPYSSALPRSVSSPDWRTQPRLARGQERVEIDVVVPRFDPGDADDEADGTVPFELDFADARIRPRNAAQWEQARRAGEDAGARAAAAAAIERRKWLDELAAPMPSPVGKPAQAWSDYELQLARRLRVRLGYGFQDVILVPKKGHEDHADQLAYVVGIPGEMAGKTLEERELDYHYAYASVDPHVAYRALLPVAQAAPAGSWTGATVVYVGEPEHDAEMRAAVERAGATYLFMDITQPLPGEHPEPEPEEE